MSGVQVRQGCCETARASAACGSAFRRSKKRSTGAPKGGACASAARDCARHAAVRRNAAQLSRSQCGPTHRVVEAEALVQHAAPRQVLPARVVGVDVLEQRSFLRLVHIV